MSLNIASLYTSHGLALKPKTAGELCGPCPWCGGKDRFTIFAGQGADGLGRFWCRQCGKGGDTIQFVRDLHEVSFAEANKILGLPDTPRRRESQPEREQPKTPEFTPSPIVPPNAAWQERAANLVFWAACQLRETPEVQEWLLLERGITLNAALSANLGWIPQDYYRPREAFGLPPEIKENGKPRRVWIPRGLSIPVVTGRGEILRVKIRVAPEPGRDRPKYIPIPQVEKCTVPFLRERHTGAAVWQVVESELDAVLLAQEAGHLVNVAAMGSA